MYRSKYNLPGNRETCVFIAKKGTLYRRDEETSISKTHPVGGETNLNHTQGFS